MRRLVVALATLLPFAACSTAPPFDAKAVVQEWAAYMNQDHTLVPGDILEIAIPDLVGSPSVRAAVSAEGAVSLPKLERSIITTNKTVGQFRLEVVEAYRRENFSVSSVTVTLATPSTKSVYVCGEVKEPGPVAWTEQLSVAKAVAATGGTIVTANWQDVYVTRADPATQVPRSYRVNLKQVLYGESMDFPLLPGDVVFVQTSVGGDIAYFVDLWVRRVLPIESVGAVFGIIAFSENRRN
ncbi:MAG: SLBB domain-containing protein [Planctomycetota bacterium]